MNARFETMAKLLAEGRYFKLVCGAGNENAQEVERLAMVYTLAGANGFDVSATPEIVSACVSGIDRAYAAAETFGVDIPVRPYIMVSVGMPGDHHVRKAHIIDACVSCGKCIPVCPTDAIPKDLVIVRDLCIGCGNCEAACPPKVAAIRYEHNGRALRELLPRCLEAGAEHIELHAAVPDDEAIMEEWRIVADVQPDRHISMCLDRNHLSNTQLVARIREAREIAGERLIIQADGVPMSGGTDDYNTTLQAIAIADVITKNLIQKDRTFRKLPLLLSGGTNTYTGDLARLCGVPFGGVAIGTHARKIVKPFIEQADFWTSHEAVAGAVEVARDLVVRNIAGPAPVPA
jgi:ferredoxin